MLTLMLIRSDLRAELVLECPVVAKGGGGHLEAGGRAWLPPLPLGRRSPRGLRRDALDGLYGRGGMLVHRAVREAAGVRGGRVHVPLEVRPRGVPGLPADNTGM